jgi:hypothetical protein
MEGQHASTAREQEKGTDLTSLGETGLVSLAFLTDCERVARALCGAAHIHEQTQAA